jgi:DNA-binding NtrC family response regulator
MDMLSVLIIDNDEQSLSSLNDALANKEVSISWAGTRQEAKAKIDGTRKGFDVVICNLNMKRMNGVEFSRNYYSKFPIVLISDVIEDRFMEKVGAHCDAFLEPGDVKQRIYPALLKAIERREQGLVLEAA